jgi:predicted phosphodiesterase
MPARIAILADIHANAWALAAVLEHASRQDVSAMWNLGDVLYGALEPRKTYELLGRHKIALTIRGNQDREIYDATGLGRSSNPTLDYVINDLGREPIDWLSSLPPTAVFEDRILLCHGTPSSDVTYLLEDVRPGHPVVRCEAEITPLLGDIRQPVIVCGHTHIPRLVRLATGQIIVNPGSVGLPAYSDSSPAPHAMENHSPHARYAILTEEPRGWSVAFHKIPYDWEAASKRAAELGRPDWARALATGRVLATNTAVS